MVNEQTETFGLQAKVDTGRPRGILSLSPAKMALVMTAFIFIAELLVMLLLDRLPTFSPLVEAIVDASFLIVFLVPVYIALYRPFWKARQQAQEDIRQLNYRLTVASEDERRRIALDLHDHCDQTLVALQRTVEAIQLRLIDSDEESAALCQEVDELLGRLNSDVRSVSAALHPPELESQGISAALRQCVVQMQSKHAGTTIEFLCKGEPRPIEKGKAISIYRIAQEALQNAIQHSGGTLVRVYLEFSPSSVAISVVDNGSGFDPKQCLNEGSLGLVAIRERAKSHGGSFTIHSEPQKGTSLRVSML